MEVETKKKSQRETTQNIENVGKKSGVMVPSINNRIQEIEERISDAEDSAESIDNNSQRKCKMQKAPHPKHPGNPGQNKKSKPKVNR